MRPDGYRPITRIIGSVVLCAILAACAGSPAAQAPTVETAEAIQPPAPTRTLRPTLVPTPSDPTAVPTQSDAEIKAGIQQALDLYVKAFNQNKPDLLKQAVDQVNLPFRRFVQTEFDNGQKSFLAGLGWSRLKVKSIKRRDLNFVQAHIQTDGGSVADWLFRQVGDRWVISEPTSKQLGERQKVETEHFTFYMYLWADDVNATVIELVEQARRNAVERLGKQPSQKADVYIKPIYGLTPFDNPFYLAYYSPNRKPEGPDRIEIFAPHSMNFGFYDPAIGFEQPLETILTHEYAHMIHKRNFDNVGYLSSWMSEGLAEYVADNSREWEVREAVRTGNIIPIIDTVSPVYKQDLQHMETLEKDRSLAYGLACSLVAYINERHGGMEGFWKLAQAYEETQQLDVALKETFGVSFEEFDQGWRQWLEETYG